MKVVVTTKQGASFQGVKVWHPWKLVLLEARSVEHDAKLKGRLEFPRSNVAMVQVL